MSEEHCPPCFTFSKMKNQRTTFTLLLTVLALVDIFCILTFLGLIRATAHLSGYLVSISVDYSVVKVWDLTVTNHVLLTISAYLWFPMKNVMLTLESYLIIAIALERYLAVCR